VNKGGAFQACTLHRYPTDSVGQFPKNITSQFKCTSLFFRSVIDEKGHVIESLSIKTQPTESQLF
jgi:hypothetical protein